MPAEVRAAFNEAQRRLSQSIKTAENPSAESPQVAEQRRNAAAIVISAKTVSADQARKNVVAAYEHQHKAGVDALSSAIDRVKAVRPRNPRKTPKRKPFPILSHRWLPCSWLQARNRVRTSNLSANTLRALLGQSGSALFVVPGDSEFILGCADSAANRSSDTNRVGPVSLAQGNGSAFLFLALGSGNAQFGGLVDERLVHDVPLISLAC
jgi:hypothetical protein